MHILTITDIFIKAIYLLLCLSKSSSTIVEYLGSSQGLTSMPTDIPFNVTHLYLDGNSITNIEHFMWQNFTNMKYVTLNRNDIATLNSDAFSGNYYCSCSTIYSNLK